MPEKVPDFPCAADNQLFFFIPFPTSYSGKWHFFLSICYLDSCNFNLILVDNRTELYRVKTVNRLYIFNFLKVWFVNAENTHLLCKGKCHYAADLLFGQIGFRRFSYIKIINRFTWVESKPVNRRSASQ